MTEILVPQPDYSTKKSSQHLSPLLLHSDSSTPPYFGRQRTFDFGKPIHLPLGRGRILFVCPSGHLFHRKSKTRSNMSQPSDEWPWGPTFCAVLQGFSHTAQSNSLGALFYGDRCREAEENWARCDYTYQRQSTPIFLPISARINLARS